MAKREGWDRDKRRQLRAERIRHLENAMRKLSDAHDADVELQTMDLDRHAQGYSDAAWEACKAMIDIWKGVR